MEKKPGKKNNVRNLPAAKAAAAPAPSSLQAKHALRREAIAKIEAALNANAQQIAAIQAQNVNLERDLHTQVGARLQIEELMAEEAVPPGAPPAETAEVAAAGEHAEKELNPT